MAKAPGKDVMPSIGRMYSRFNLLLSRKASSAVRSAGAVYSAGGGDPLSLEPPTRSTAVANPRGLYGRGREAARTAMVNISKEQRQVSVSHSSKGDVGSWNADGGTGQAGLRALQ